MRVSNPRPLLFGEPITYTLSKQKQHCTTILNKKTRRKRLSQRSFFQLLPHDRDLVATEHPSRGFVSQSRKVRLHDVSRHKPIASVLATRSFKAAQCALGQDSFNRRGEQFWQHPFRRKDQSMIDRSACFITLEPSFNYTIYLSW